MDIQKEEDDFNAWFNKQTINAVPDADLSLQRLWSSLAWQAQAAKAQAVPESTGLTDVNGKLIFVGDTVEFIGGCRDFLDLSGYGARKYIVNKGDQMIVRKLKSGYTLSLPWIDCDTPNRIGNLGNYDFWNIHRDFVVIEAQEPAND